MHDQNLEGHGNARIGASEEEVEPVVRPPPPIDAVLPPFPLMLRPIALSVFVHVACGNATCG